MTLYINIGRRMPKRGMRRLASRVKGLVSFQENMWNIISESMKKARRAAKRDGRLVFIIERYEEPEDLFYVIQWMRIKIRGTPEQELEEKREAECMYDKLDKHMKSSIDTDENFSKQFKSKRLPTYKLKEAYEKGFGAVKNKDISHKLLELGIMTHIELVDDYAHRAPDINL